MKPSKEHVLDLLASARDDATVKIKIIDDLTETVKSGKSSGLPFDKLLDMVQKLFSPGDDMAEAIVAKSSKPLKDKRLH